MRPQASEGEAQQPFCWTGRFGQGHGVCINKIPAEASWLSGLSCRRAHQLVVEIDDLIEPRSEQPCNLTPAKNWKVDSPSAAYAFFTSDCEEDAMRA
jgi:hypothetical protein